MTMKRMMSVSVAAASAALFLSLTGGAAAPACDPDNGGLKLPEGFCALVVAENVGPARHLVVAPNGNLYVSTRNGRGAPGGVVALQDNNGDEDFHVYSSTLDGKTVVDLTPIPKISAQVVGVSEPGVALPAFRSPSCTVNARF